MALGADWQQIQSRPNIDDDEHGRAIDDTKYKVVRKTWILVLFSGPSFGPEEKAACTRQGYAYTSCRSESSNKRLVNLDTC